MDRTEILQALLIHIRRIHFSILIVSITLIYLAYVGWNPVPELVKELKVLERTIEMLEQKNSLPEELAILVLWDWANNNAEKIRIMLESEELTGQSLKWSAIFLEKKQLTQKAFRIRSTSTYLKKELSNLSMTQLDQVLENLYLEVETIEKFVISKNEHTPSIWPKKYIGYGGEKKPYIRDINIERWQNSENEIGVVKITLGLELEVRRPTSITFAKVKESWKKDFILHFNSKIEEIKLEKENFWNQFKLIKHDLYWNELKDKSILNAIKWAQRQKTMGLKSQKTNLVGIELQGEHVALFGPIVIICLFLYLLSYLFHIERIINQKSIEESKNNVSKISSWVGTMENYWARLITIFSLVLIPLLAVVLPIWRFTSLGLYISLTFGIILSLLGGICVKMSRKISKKNV